MSGQVAERTQTIGGHIIGTRGEGRGLLSGFAGAVHLPGDAGYDEKRQALYPGMDPRPALVAEAAGAGDVRAAVLAARERGLPFAVQATGHGTRVSPDGGLLLKTSGMSSVLVDPCRRIARVGPGAVWADVLAAAAPFGLAPLSGSAPGVGVTGYTLGGGLGWLSRAYGFAADNVLRAQVVLADGREVTAAPDRHPDLFWALRGGGGNFGVVTGLEFRLHPVSRVYAGAVHFPIERAPEILQAYRRWAAAVPSELSSALLLTRAGDGPDVPEALRGRRVVTLKVMYAGDAERAERLLRPLRAAAGTPLADDLRTVEYAQARMGGTPARHFDMYEDLTGPVLDALARDAANPASSVATVEIRHWGGAMADPAPEAGPVGHRSASFSIIVDAPDTDLAGELRPHGLGVSFLNFLADPGKVATAYTGEDLRRLADVKRAYDPDNVFSVNLNIAPASGRARHGRSEGSVRR
ncbi:FAD-binding oxidoreductase [Microbispora sp. NPDC049125]|uniref:FAD-binding oxidoreductase n=1 Tax=Microbispora sp. NPDC049125 TaxID=3154929 RepID=UPI003467244D